MRATKRVHCTRLWPPRSYTSSLIVAYQLNAMRTLTIREFYPLTRNFYIPAIHHALFTIKYRRKAV